jgi:hypothetical protein
LSSRVHLCWLQGCHLRLSSCAIIWVAVLDVIWGRRRAFLSGKSVII